MYSHTKRLQRVFRALVCLFVFLISCSLPAASATSLLVGSWTFVSDSDGATADNGVTVTLSFNLSGVAFSALGSGENITDNGSYSTSGPNITINLAKIGKSANNQPFAMNGNSLVLPFKVFSNGSGTSTWFRVITPGGASGGTSNPPQNPPGNPNNPNNPNNPANPNNPGDKNNPSNPNNPDNPNNPNPNNPNPDNPNPPDNPPNPPTPPNAPNPPQQPNQPNPNNPHNPNSPQNPNGPLNPAIAPYVGDWVGNGWSWETRFRQSRKDFTNQMFHGIPDQMADRSNVQGNVMEVAVEHQTEFAFTVDEHGHIEGRGAIVYSVFPNLCGLAVLTQQVNQTINRMKDMAAIYKQANEIGTGVLHTFNKDWMEKESELAETFKTLNEVETRIAPTGGRYAASAGEGEQEIEKDVAKYFEDLGAKPGTRRLALDEILSRCGSSTNYEVAGGLPCDLVTNPAVQNELKSGIKEFGKAMNETADDSFWEGIVDPGKELMGQLTGVEKEADAACLGTDVTNAEQFYDLIKDKFNEIYAKDLKGVGTNGAVAAVGNLAKHEDILEAKALAEGLDPNGMVNMMLSIPGVTQVAYAYKALPNGPEKRLYRMTGYLEPSSSGGAPTMRLSMNTDDAWGGKKNLEVDYMVNFKWTQGFFPIWTPFPDKPAQAHLSGTVALPKQTWGDGEGEGEGEEGAPEPPTKMTMKIPFAMYHDTGTHRNGVVPWQEYEYFWFAHKVTQPKGSGPSEPSSAKPAGKEE